MVDWFKGKRVLVMGLGLQGGGLSVTSWLLKHKAIITVTDVKTLKQLKFSLDAIKKLPGAKQIKYTLGRHDLADFANQDLIIKNPGVPNDSVFLAKARQSKIPIMNEAVLFFGVFEGPVIGVTGTRGKSTTTTLIHEILKTKIKTNVLAGNIAITPMMSVADKLPVDSWPVLELSSWHLESMDDYKVAPQIAVVTNVMIDHLNRYKNFAEYKRAKLAIVANQIKGDVAILNADNIHTRDFAKQTKAEVFWFSLKKKVKGAYLSGQNIYFYDGHKNQLVMPIDKIKLRGRHNLANILAAVAVAKILNISNKNIAKAINNFRGLQYRLQYLGRLGQRLVYNDSTSTTPDAATAALQALSDKKIILIAGGVDKELDYKILARHIKKHVSYLVLLEGSGSDKLIRELQKISWPRHKMLANVKDLRTAWQAVLSWPVKTDTYILFSPAATSFNMFINEFDRAGQFDKLFYGQKAKK